MTTSDHAGESSGPKFSLFWGIYGQVAAVLGAITLLVFASHFVDVGLKGVIREAFDWWVLNVRPLVGQPIQWLVSQLPEAWRFEVPEIMKDYVAVGAVSLFSFVRTIFGYGGEWSEFFDWESIWTCFLLLTLWPLFMFWWPLWVSFDYFRGEKSDSEVVVFSWLYAAPLIYLILIFAANTWLL
ncbi:MAG: hypothetical protein ACK6A4_02390 [Alphaproteobacteria bacterium]|jgi:hypothetical protein